MTHKGFVFLALLTVACSADADSEDPNDDGQDCIDCGVDAGPEPEASCAETCGGCCDADGQCIETTTAAACGAAGSACTTCGGGTECRAGVCAAAIGSVCTDQSQCGSADVCLLNPTESEATCRPICSNSIPCDSLADHCIPTSDGRGACVPDPSLQTWKVRAVSALIDSSINFDPFGGRPDPYLALFVGQSFSQNTQTIDDSRSPVWNFTYSGTFSPSQLRAVLLWLKDDDGGSDANIAFMENQRIEPFWGGQPHRFELASQGALNLVIEVVPE